MESVRHVAAHHGPLKMPEASPHVAFDLIGRPTRPPFFFFSKTSSFIIIIIITVSSKEEGCEIIYIFIV